MQSTMTRAVAATALALTLAAAASAQDTSGYAGGSYFRTDIEDGGDTDGFVIDGAFFTNLGALNLQANADATLVDEDDGDDSLAGDLHLFARNSESYAFGGFGSVIDPEDDETIWGVGAEGEIYSNQWTFGGVAGYFDSDDFDSIKGVCGYGRLYGSESFSIEGRAGLVNFDFGPGDDDAFLIGGGAEYMFSGSGISIAGGVDRTEFDEIDLEATTIRFGGKYHFGTRSLMDRDRRGAGLKGSRCIRDAVPF